MPRELTTIRIEPTTLNQRHAQIALDMQDELSGRIVAQQLCDTMVAIWSECYSWQIGSHLKHPIALCLLNRLNQLANLDQSRSECFIACHELADGNPVNWTVSVEA